MALTDVAIKNAKPRAKPYKMGDAGGLHLLVTPAGGKLWRMKYRIGGKDARKEKLLSLGAWPAVSLKRARAARDKAKEALATGADPARVKQVERQCEDAAQANTFGEIGTEYLDKRRREGLSASTADKSDYYVSRLGTAFVRLPISEITAPDLLAVLRRIEAKGNYETAKRVLQLAGRIFRYAVATARLASDPARDLRGALTATQPKHYGAIVDAKRAGELLRAIDTYEGQAVTMIALQLSPHLFVRPGELRHADWSEIDLEGALWTIPAGKMKMKRPHVVPLSQQAAALFRRLHAITGPKGYAFPSIRAGARPMSENTVNAGLRRLGFAGDEMTAHGFRAMASTLLNESGRWNPDAIERALAHGDEDRVRAAYHRGTHWQERVSMAQWWSDRLDTLRTGAEILPFPNQGTG